MLTQSIKINISLLPSLRSNNQQQKQQSFVRRSVYLTCRLPAACCLLQTQQKFSQWRRQRPPCAVCVRINLNVCRNLWIQFNCKCVNLIQYSGEVWKKSWRTRQLAAFCISTVYRPCVGRRENVTVGSLGEHLMESIIRPPIISINCILSLITADRTTVRAASFPPR